jgi:DNA-binding FadR family transcriptional regulator
MEKALPGTAEAGQADVDFHLALFRASHNHLWIRFGQVLSFALGQLFKTNAMQDKYPEELPLHREALQAIRLKDEEAAGRALQRLTRHSVATCEEIVREHFLIPVL